MISIEQMILACSAELKADLYQQQRLHRLMNQGMDVDHLINMAIDEGLTGFLYKNMVKSGELKNLNDEQIECIRFLYHRNTFFNLKLIHDFKKVLHQLNQNRIRVVLLKGISLLNQVYDDIGLRPMMDIDLWIPNEDYPELIRILTLQGYRRGTVYPNTFMRGPTTIDLHSHILGERIKARELLFSQNHFYDNAQSIDFEGEETLCLNKYDQVIYLSLHALKHNVDRLIWLVDIKNVIAGWKRSDWEALKDRALYVGQQKSVSYVFFLLRDLFDFQFPPEARKLFGDEKLLLLEKKLLRERKKKGALPAWAPLLLFSPEGRLKKRFNFILETLFPRLEILRQVFVNFSERKAWQLYCMRVLQLISMIKLSLKRRIGIKL